jgi:hypothetical protein
MTSVLGWPCILATPGIADLMGMVDGPICCDIDHPNAMLIHTHIEDMDSAMQWLPPAASAGA